MEDKNRLDNKAIRNNTAQLYKRIRAIIRKGKHGQPVQSQQHNTASQ